MSTMQYIVITASEDGCYHNVMSKEELEEKLNNEWWGADKEWWDEFPGESDHNYWGNIGIILEVSRVVVPRAAATVTRWELP